MEQFRAKIEEHGNYYEKQGFSPVAARIMIYLLLHPDGEATFDDIVSFFGVSKSAVSNALKILSATKIVTELTKSGARKRYFSSNFKEVFSAEIAVKGYRETREILEDIKKVRKKKDKVSEDLSGIVDFIKLLEVEYPKIYEKARKQHQKGK
jgi:DNA-binding transcriptional regulator GbsR (MarR family)